jgi:Tol biopolymer transport system component
MRRGLVVVPAAFLRRFRERRRNEPGRARPRAGGRGETQQGFDTPLGSTAKRVFMSLVVLASVAGTACMKGSSPSEANSSAASSPPAITLGELKGTILFTRAGGQYGDETVFTANADGTNEQRITPFGAELPGSGQCCPRWSPDGTHVSMAVPAPGGRITAGIINADGGGARQIPLPDRTLNLAPMAWSPDGARLAFQGWDDTNPSRTGIYIGRASDGGDLVRLTRNTQGGQDLPGDFSPDGEQLVFFREDPSQQSVGRLFVIDVDGSGLHPITPTNLAVGFGTVRWSPDGRKILFQDAQNATHGYLWTVGPDGSDLTKVFADTDDRFAISPTWSPDGRYILFALDPTAAEFSHPTNGLYVIRENGTGLTQLIDGNDFKRLPDWVAQN